MPKRSPPRKNDDELPSRSIASTIQYRAQIAFDIEPKGKNWIVKFIDKEASGLVDGDDVEGWYLAIQPGKNWEITFTLSANWNWKFDENPISFKTAGDAAHYRVASQSGTTLVVEAYSTLPAGNPAPKHDVLHPFNLYVLIDQSSKKSYPVTIDPDVKNPPVGSGRKSEPTSNPVPLA